MNYLFEGKITEKEYLDASLSILLQKGRIIVILISMLAVLIITQLFTKMDIYLFFGMMFFCFVFFSLEYFILIPSRLKKNYRKSKKWNQTRKWIIDDEHFEIITEDSTTKFTWDEFTKYIKTKNSVLLGLKSPKGMFHIIPSRIINESNNDDFYSFIKSHIIK